MKEKVLMSFIIILSILLILSAWYSKVEQNRLYKEIHRGNELILKKDKLTKEDDGQYAKLVNYFNTQKDLNKQLKEQNESLYKLIKKQDEKLLMINNTIITLKSEISEGFGNFNEKDTNLIDLTLKYPNDDNSFIEWGGFINRNTAFYNGEWTFGKLPLQIILTETDRGIWKSRLIGPEWLIVDSMDINSLPFPKQETPKNLSFMFGSGYVKSFNPQINDGLSIGFGVKWKQHNMIINAFTTEQIGFNYYYNLTNFNKK